MVDKTQVARVQRMAAIVAENEPLAGRNLYRAEVVFIPIFFIRSVDAVGAKTRREDMALAGQPVVVYISVFQTDVNDVRVVRDRVGKSRVVGDITAVASIHLEDVCKVKALIKIGAVHKERSIPDLYEVARQAAEAVGKPGRPPIGGRCTEKDQAGPPNFPKTGGKRKPAAKVARSIKARQKKCDKNGFQWGLKVRWVLA